jgi:DNA-binding transcriptional regulator YiaG
MVKIVNIYQYQLIELHQWNDEQKVTYYKTQQELADYLKVHLMTVKNWIKGDTENKKRRDIKIFRGKFPVYKKTPVEYKNDEII